MAVTPATFTPDHVTMLNVPEGAVPVEQGTQIVEDVMANSAMMQVAKYVEMTKPEKEFDVYLNGIGAYWVGEGQRIQTTKPTWARVKMVAKKIAVIVPVTREYLHYKQSDFFNFIKPKIAEAFYRKFDAATFLGADNPYAQSIKDSATKASNIVTGDLNVTNFDNAFGLVTDSGYMPNAVISKTQNNSLLRGMIRDTDGLKERIYTGTSLDGLTVVDMHKDIAEFKKGTLITGDFDKAFYGIPYNMNYEISTDATLTTIVGEDGAPVNLFEREMAALRVSMDVAFMVINDEAFAMIEPTTV